MASELALSDVQGVSTTSEFGDGECSKESAWCAWVSTIRHVMEVGLWHDKVVGVVLHLI
jgi:hypothetical protein